MHWAFAAHVGNVYYNQQTSQGNNLQSNKFSCKSFIGTELLSPTVCDLAQHSTTSHNHKVNNPYQAWIKLILNTFNIRHLVCPKQWSQWNSHKSAISKLHQATLYGKCIFATPIFHPVLTVLRTLVKYSTVTVTATVCTRIAASSRTPRNETPLEPPAIPNTASRPSLFRSGSRTKTE